MKNKSIIRLMFASFLLYLVFVSYLLKNLLSNEDDILTRQLCLMLTSNSLRKFGRTNQYLNKIPKIIHYVYKSAYIPTQYSPHVKNCMEINKDAKFVFWNDLLAYRFMMNHFQSYLGLYSSYLNNNIDPLKISDVIRYFILYKFGGIYMDLDTKCQKSFDVVMINSHCILSQEVNEQTRILWNLPYLAMNSLMASTPNHDFFKYIIDKLTKADGIEILSQTGPIFLTKLFETYKKLLANKSYSLQPVTLADPYIFSHHTEEYLERQCYKISGKWKIKGCNDLPMHRNLQKTKTKDAIVVHLFMHLGYTYAKGYIKRLDNICLIFQKLEIVWS